MKHRYLLAVVPAALLLAGCSTDITGHGESSTTVAETVVHSASSSQAAPEAREQTQTPEAQEPQSQQLDSDPSLTDEPQSELSTDPGVPAEYVGKWMGHGRSLELNADGTGVLSLNSGAANNSTYSIIWAGSGNGIAVTVQQLIGSYGSGTDIYQPGQTVPGAFGSPSAGRAVELGGTLYCDSAADQTGICGA